MIDTISSIKDTHLFPIKGVDKIHKYQIKKLLKRKKFFLYSLIFFYTYMFLTPYTI
jgi:hypothetical protein